MITTNSGTTTTSCSGYIPPKMWKDLSADEKLERIREQIKFLQRDIPNIRGQINQVKHDFKNHDHLNGKIVKDIKIESSCLVGAKKLANYEAEAKGEVYF